MLSKRLDTTPITQDFLEGFTKISDGSCEKIGSLRTTVASVITSGFFGAMRVLLVLQASSNLQLRILPVRSLYFLVKLLIKD